MSNLDQSSTVPDLHPAATLTDTDALEQWLQRKQTELARTSVISALMQVLFGIASLVGFSFVIFMCLIWTHITGELIPNPGHVLVVLAVIFVAYPFIGRNRSSAKQDRLWWKILGIFFTPPYCFDQAITELRAAKQARTMDIESCAAVLTRIWDRGRVVYNHQLLEWVPHIDLEQTLKELGMIPGIVFMTETPGITCSQPLFEEIGRFLRDRTA